MDNRTFKNREDIPLKDRWATEDLYASDELWEQELQHMIEQGKEMAGYAGIVGRDAQTLLSSLRSGAAGYCGVMCNFHPRLYSWLVHHFDTEPQKASVAADLCSMTAFTESLAYPITAKYHLNHIAGVPMSLYAKSRKAEEFTPYHAMCVRQMDELVQAALKMLEA